jgi:HEAT repeat protein
MRSRTAYILATLFLIVAAAIIGWFSLGHDEPRYKGRSLSSWVEAYGHSEERPEFGEAIQKIGTNAFPLLLEWIREPEPQRHPLLLRIAGILPRQIRPKWAIEGYVPRCYQSAYAFGPLGNQASPVIPDLSALAAHPNPGIAGRALAALRNTGSNGVPALLSMVRDPSHPYRGPAAVALGLSVDLGPYTNTVARELVERLEDAAVSSQAALALGHLKARPDLVVPALAHQLEKTNTTSKLRVAAVTSLGRFGEKAAPALPYLTNALNDPSLVVRQMVGNAIKTIHSSVRKE